MSSPISITPPSQHSPSPSSASTARSPSQRTIVGPHVVLSTPRCTWKKGNVSDYVSKARVFYDTLHESITLFTGSPINRAWTSIKHTGTWQDYTINLTLDATHDILGAQLSPDKSLMAVRVSDKEVKVLSTATGEVLTARSCRTPTRMISVHWLGAELTLLFVTNAGVELYSLVRGKLKHIKTAPYQIVYHWVLLSESLLLLVDSRSVFTIYQLSTKNIVKLCRFELDCSNTCIGQPANGQSFHRDQISLLSIYDRMVVAFVNESKAQLHLLSLMSNSDEMEQTHVYDLYQPGKYEMSVIDDVLVAHQSSHRVSLLFDLKTDNKQALIEPCTIGPPLPDDDRTIIFYDPHREYVPVTVPADFVPYKWKFLSPRSVWESIGDQQQGHFWSLALNHEAIALSWPVAKRAKLVDYLMKRTSAEAKVILLQLILQLIETEPKELSLISRMFAMINKINFDHFNYGGDSRLSSPSASLPPPSLNRGMSQLNVDVRSSTPTRSNSIQSSPRSRPSMTRTKSSSVSDAAIVSNIEADMDATLDCEKLLATIDEQLTQSAVMVEQNVNGYLIITQHDLLVHVYLKSYHRHHTLPTHLLPSLMELVRSLHRHSLRVDEALNDFLFLLLLKSGDHWTLHQSLQHHIIADSIAIANKLLECQSLYPAFYQLSLDMLYRLQCFTRLIQIHLSNYSVLAALKLVTPKSALFEREGFQPRDWLRAAKLNGDDQTFFTTFRFMETRNLLTRNTNVFYPSDRCEEFILHYTLLFGPIHRINPPASHQPLVLRDGDSRLKLKDRFDGMSVDEIRAVYSNEIGDDYDEIDESDWNDGDIIVKIEDAAKKVQQTQSQGFDSDSGNENGNGDSGSDGVNDSNIVSEAEWRQSTANIQQPLELSPTDNDNDNVNENGNDNFTDIVVQCPSSIVSSDDLDNIDESPIHDTNDSVLNGEDSMVAYVHAEESDDNGSDSDSDGLLHQQSPTTATTSSHAVTLIPLDRTESATVSSTTLLESPQQQRGEMCESSVSNVNGTVNDSVSADKPEDTSLSSEVKTVSISDADDVIDGGAETVVALAEDASASDTRRRRKGKSGGQRKVNRGRPSGMR